jgi:predicted Zn-dependent protease
VKAQEVAERALELAGPAGLAVIVHEGSQVNLRWAGNGLTTNGHIVGQDVDVVAFADVTGGTATATASGHVTDATDLADLVARAQRTARGAQPAEDAAPLVDGGAGVDWRDDPTMTDSGMLTGVAAGLGEAFRRARGDGVEHFGYAEHDVTTTFLATSAGTRLRHTQAQGRVEFTAKSHARSRSSWVGLAGTDFAVVDVPAVDDQLRQALDWQSRTVAVTPGRHPVLLSPSAAADLMVELYWSADARTALDGQSVFSAPGGGTRVGEQLGGAVSLVSDPADPAADDMGCAPFEISAASSQSSSTFDNGLALGRTEWISDGMLRHLISTRYSAGLAGVAATPGIDNLSMSTPSGHGSLAEVIARMDHGLVVTCLWYNRLVDPQTLLTTGLTRDGVYVVEDGRIVGTCGNFRFNESPVSLLGRIVDAGDPVRTLAREMGDYFNRARMPPLLIDEFNLSTASEAL